MPLTKVSQHVVNLSPIVQTQSVYDGAVYTGTTTIPDDDTIPQNTEGDQYLSVSITPKSTTNILKIRAVLHTAYSVSAIKTVCLFKDSDANALACTYHGSNIRAAMIVEYEMLAGTTSQITFKIRAGGSTAGTMTVNGSGGTRRYGGVMASFIEVTEIGA